MGQLVTDSRFLMTSSYSSRSRSTDSEGSTPLFEEKPWAMHCHDSNMGQGAHGLRAPKYWPLVDPSLSTPRSGGALEQLSNPLEGQPSNSWVIMGCRSIFSFVSLLTYGGRWPAGGGELLSGAFLEGAARGRVRMPHEGTW
jgi:hypothetical protein